jgi:hypothetical protein
MRDSALRKKEQQRKRPGGGGNFGYGNGWLALEMGWYADETFHSGLVWLSWPFGLNRHPMMVH